MNGRAFATHFLSVAAGCAAVLGAAGGCGDARPAAQGPVAEVRGTPLRAAKPPELPPEAAALGDVDAGKASATPPTIVGAAVGAAVAAARTAPAPESAPSEPAKPAKPAAESYSEYRTATFDDLAGFEYALYAEDVAHKHEVPPKVLALSGKKVAVDGYMMPIACEAGGAKKFLLMKNQYGCCFAATPKINEWIEVTMQGDKVAEYIAHTLVTVWGELEVTPESREGIWTGLYKMKATRSEFTEAK